MGLDIVELVMDIEEAFQIRIENDEAVDVHTVGDLHALILRKHAARERKVCLSSRAFFRVRRVLHDWLHIPRKNVLLAGDIDAVIPRADRRNQWREFSRQLGWLRLPNLVRPYWLSWSLCMITFTSILAGLIGLLVSKWGFPIFQSYLLILGGAAFGFVTYQATKPFAVRTPAECSTIRGLVGSVLRLNYVYLASWNERGADRETWNALCKTVGVSIGVDPETLEPKTRFVEDLGLS